MGAHNTAHLWASARWAMWTREPAVVTSISARMAFSSHSRGRVRMYVSNCLESAPSGRGRRAEGSQFTMPSCLRHAHHGRTWYGLHHVRQQLSMDHERQSASGVEVRQRGGKVADIRVLKVADAAGTHERLEAHHASIQQCLPRACKHTSVRQWTRCGDAGNTPSAQSRCLRWLGPGHPRMRRPHTACPVWTGREG